MSKRDENDKRLVCEILEKAGLRVEHVPQSRTQSCDLRAKSGKQENYLFEVKGFHDSKALARALRSGKDYSEALAFDTARAVQAGIREGIKQLESTARKNADELRFLALLVRSKFDAKVVFPADSGTPVWKTKFARRFGDAGQGRSPRMSLLLTQRVLSLSNRFRWCTRGRWRGRYVISQRLRKPASQSATNSAEPVFRAAPSNARCRGVREEGIPRRRL